MNNNQSKRSKKKAIKKQKLKEVKQREQKQQKIEFENSFIDLVSFSQHLSDAQDQDVQERIDNMKEGKIQDEEEERQVVWNNLPKYVYKTDSLMVVGQKNTGKTTFCSYILSNNIENYVLLDCDIGKNSCLQGCVSLRYKNEQKKIWIGELTPLNKIQTYLRAIKYLYQTYRSIWFGKKLIINTMGYTTGLGQYLHYNIFQILKPQSILQLKQPQKQSTYNSAKKLIQNIQNGQYTSKLYFNKNITDTHPTSTKIFSYQNVYASSKKRICRFERFFSFKGEFVKNFYELIQLMEHSRSPLYQEKLFYKERKDIQVIEDGRKQGQMFRVIDKEQSIDMRLIILGNIVHLQNEEQNLFEASSVGFCFKDMIYSPHPLQNVTALISEGMDFQKRFYHLNQKQMIDLQLKYGRIPYLLVQTKGLGSKGVRNNPSKTQLQ